MVLLFPGLAYVNRRRHDLCPWFCNHRFFLIDILTFILIEKLCSLCGGGWLHFLLPTSDAGLGLLSFVDTHSRLLLGWGRPRPLEAGQWQSLRTAQDLLGGTEAQVPGLPDEFPREHVQLPPVLQGRNPFLPALLPWQGQTEELSPPWDCILQAILGRTNAKVFTNPVPPGRSRSEAECPPTLWGSAHLQSKFSVATETNSGWFQENVFKSAS